MALPLIGVLAIVGAVLWFGSRSGLNPFSNENRAAAQAREQEKADERDAKGAVGNTWDFFAGEGSFFRTFSGNKGKGTSQKQMSPPGRGPGPRHTKGRGRIV